MGKSRSRSRSGDRGRWGDPDSGFERGRDRHHRRDRQERSRSRDRHRREQERSRDRDRDRDHDRDRDRSRERKRRREASPQQGDRAGSIRVAPEPEDRGQERAHGERADREAGKERDRSRDRERDRDRGRDRDRERERGRDSDRGGDRDRHRDRSRDRSRGRGRSRERDGQGTYRRNSPRGDAAGGEPQQHQRRWRSPSADAGRRGADGRGDGAMWNNPPPPFATGRPPPPPLSIAPPPVGSIHRGTVHTIRPFGIFVALPGYKRHVMVHNTQVSDELRFTREDDEDAKVKALEFYFPRGEQVWVKVSEVTPDERNPAEMRVNGSLRAVDQASGTDLDPQGLLTAPDQQHGGAGGGGRGRGGPETDEPPEVGSVHRAVVKRIEAYGVFVALEGYRRHGLVHTSQVSNYLSFNREDSDEQKKAELSGVVTVGEQIWVKVVEVAPDEARGGYKIGCSIKLVSQADGEDLDPANTRYKPRDAAGRGAGGGAVGASAGEVGKGGKIDWGHLAADTKLYVNEKAAAQYKLLEEEPAPRLPGPPPGPPGMPGPPGAPGRPGPPPASAPVGRGRGMVLPAWVTQGGAAGGPAAPGSLPGPPPLQQEQQQLAPSQLPASSKFELKGVRDVDPSSLLLDLVGGGGGEKRISSIEEALAILEAHGGGRSKKKDKKKKDKGKDRKSKKEKKSKDKKSKRSSSKKAEGDRRRSYSSSSGSSSDSDSDGGRRR